MNKNENHKQARDAAWKILIDCKADRLPISVSAVCGATGIHAHTYARAHSPLKRINLEAVMQDTDGFCINFNGEYHIFYDDSQPIPHQRSTVAHEIGHIILGHIPGNRAHQNREISTDDLPEEIQANQFAAHLLAPACILRELRAFEPGRIAGLCNISLSAAITCVKRLGTLEQRQKYYLSPLERAICSNFRDFIKSFR